VQLPSPVCIFIAMRLFRHILRFAENSVLCSLLALMLGLAGLQIVLRFFNQGLFWIDPMLRLLVIWSGMFGAVVASRDKQHIAIDLLSHLLPAGQMQRLRAVLSLVAAFVCAVLCLEGYRFVVDEAGFGGNALLDMPSWLQNLIFPIAFGLMAIHFLDNAVAPEESGKERSEGITITPAAERNGG